MDLKVAIGSWETPPMQCGPAYYIEELAKRLSNHVDVTLIVPKHVSIQEKHRLTTRKISTVNLPIVRVCMFAAQASRLSNKLGVDLIHDNGVLGLSKFSPFIETWHHSDLRTRDFVSPSTYYLNAYREQLTLVGVRKADTVIAISERAKNELITNYGVPDFRVQTVTQGVDTDFFRPYASSLTDLGLRHKRVYLLYVGALAPRKNLATLVQALKIVRVKFQNVHLLIVGDGNEKARLQELTNLLGLRESVTFFGSVSRQTLLKLYNTTDYVVVPSYIEGFGLTILEGLACEKPVIMTPVGISDIVKKNHLGVVTEGFDSESIASAIAFALNERFTDLRAFVKKNFTWAKTIERTLETYKQTLDSYH